MTAADRPSVGDQITTAEQLDALPVGSVMRAQNGLLMETGTMAGRRVVRGEGWSDHSDTIEYLAPLTVLYVPGEPSRPSVTDNARAEAEKRWPRYDDDAAPYSRGAFIGFLRGAEWAAGRAEADPDSTYHEPPAWCPGCGDRIPTEIIREWGVCSNCYGTTDDPWAAGRAETTTATVEEAARVLALTDDYDGFFERLDAWAAASKEQRESGEVEEPMSTDEEDAEFWRRRARALAERGLLATARTRPTREQIARALDRAGAFCGECGAEPGDFFDSCLECQRWLLNYADAVLALLVGDDRG